MDADCVLRASRFSIPDVIRKKYTCLKWRQKLRSNDLICIKPYYNDLAQQLYCPDVTYANNAFVVLLGGRGVLWNASLRRPRRISARGQRLCNPGRRTPKTRRGASSSSTSTYCISSTVISSMSGRKPNQLERKLHRYALSKPDKVQE